MNSIKRFIVGLVCLVSVPLIGMISQKSTSRRIRAVQPEQQREQPRYKSEIVWVKTLDNVVMEVPQWQIDQMKEVQQVDENSKENPANASVVTSGQLQLIQQALQKVSNLEQFRLFYSGLSDDQQKSLLADAFTLGMQGLASLLITYMFPVDVQQQMGASLLRPANMMTPVVNYLQQPKVLEGHKGIVACVAYSPDSSSIVSGSWDKTLILWNGKTGEKIRVLKEHKAIVTCVAYSPDGSFIVSGSWDKTLILWNGKTGEKIKVLEGHKSDVTCVAYSPDGSFIVSGSWDKTLILWNGKTGEKIKVLEGHKSDVTCVAYSPDGSFIVSGSWDKTLILWNGKTGEKIKVLEGHKSDVNCVAYSPDGSSIVSGSSDKTLILWNGKTGEKIKVLEGHKSDVKCVAYSPDGSFIVSGSGDKALILWNGKTGEKIKVLEGHKGAVNCVAYSPDSSSIVSGSSDKTLILWKLINQEDLNYIATKLNLAQARFLYRLYVAKINKVPVIMDSKDLDYQLYLTLPADVQKVVSVFLPFELASDLTEKQIQEKMNELRAALFYHTSRIWGRYEKKRDEKIKAVKDMMQKFDKSSIDYKACKRLLIELEQEAAFAL